jgi:hypothetical protein
VRTEFIRRAVGAALMATTVALVGCAGTIKQDPRVTGDVSKVVGIAKVEARMTPEALKLQADNPQFSREELAGYLRRKLEAKGFVGPAAQYSVDIVVTNIRVRSAFSAIMWGALAGSDSVAATVRIVDQAGNPVRSFDVDASYALGGLAGGQDGMRMSWLYDKFSELAVAELEKVVTVPPAKSAEATPAKTGG